MRTINLNEGERELVLTALAISARQADEGSQDFGLDAERRKACRQYAKEVRALAARLEA